VITEDGSTLLEPLMLRWKSAYQGATVQVGGNGSTKGIDEASKGKVDLGASDAYLSSGDVLANNSLLNIPVVVSAQAVIYNLPGLKSRSGVSPADIHVQLSGELLSAMYRGDITMWNDSRIAALNGDLILPAIKIAPLHRAKGSGDTFLFTSYLSTQDDTWNSQVGYGTQVVWPSIGGAAPAVYAAKDSKDMYAKCGQTPGCVGYDGVSYLKSALALGLGEAALQNGGGHFTIPTPATVSAEVSQFVAITPPSETIAMIAGPGGRTYPLVNYEYAIVSSRQPSAAKAKQLRDFLSWAINDGNAPALLSGEYFPLPDDIKNLSQAQIGLIH
jgi:phosphate transport system substrate-binding protein